MGGGQRLRALAAAPIPTAYTASLRHSDAGSAYNPILTLIQKVSVPGWILEEQAHPGC